jgi:hypothetical protein
MASWFRRVEQGILQQIGAASSSYEKDATYARDEERVERLESAAKGVASQLSGYLVALRRASDAAIDYATSMEKACLAAATPLTVDVRAISRTQLGYRTSVVSAIETHLGTGQAHVAAVLRNIAALRADFAARKEKVLDSDSYARRVQQAEAAVASARDPTSIAEARDALRKLQGKARDVGAIVAQASERIRARLGQLEAELQSATADAAFAFLGAQAFAFAHAADAAAGVLPQFPGAASHLIELGDLCAHAAATHTLRAAEGGGSGAGLSGDPASNVAPSFADALRLPLGSVVGKGNGGGGDAAGSFAALHASVLPADVKTAASGRAMPGSSSAAARPATGSQLVQRAGVVRPPHAAFAPLTSTAAGATGVEGEDEFGGAVGGGGGDDNDSDGGSVNGDAGGGATNGLGTAPTVSTSGRPPTQGPPGGSSLPADAELAIATFDFEPDSPDELRLKVGGGVLRVLTKEEGWWSGRDLSTGKEGLFPFNRVRLLTQQERARYLAARQPQPAAPAPAPAAAAVPSKAAVAAGGSKPPVGGGRGVSPAATAVGDPFGLMTTATAPAPAPAPASAVSAAVPKLAAPSGARGPSRGPSPAPQSAAAADPFAASHDVVAAFGGGVSTTAAAPKPSGAAAPAPAARSSDPAFDFGAGGDSAFDFGAGGAAADPAFGFDSFSAPAGAAAAAAAGAKGAAASSDFDLFSTPGGGGGMKGTGW